MKIYVWDEFSPDYSGGLAFAIAESQEEAQKLITEHRGFHIYAWGQLSVYPLTEKTVRAISGGS